ncbi:late blight resistance protein R1-A-like [Solanum tuberosum]|uniref:late blight resistance protein R1-A-like n=1 Tax=Solanum tuberosum TaxID=4113 RepID=UPI00073A3070|nr:PREDICTED: late blight resistance protein R1-A-like [Solanum tuberosum]
MSEIERRFLGTFLFWATQKGRIKEGRLRGHGMQVGDTVSGPRADLSSAEVKEGYEFLLSLVPGRWPLPNLCSPVFQKFIEHILQNVKDLLINKKDFDKFVLLKKEFQVLEESLKYLKTFLNFIKDASMELEKSNILFNHIEGITVNAAYICYLCYVEEMDGDSASVLTLQISHVLKDIKPIDPDVAEIYTGALRGSVKLQIQYSRDVIEFVEGFVHFIFKDLLELSDGEACSLMLPLKKDQIKSLAEASKQLITLLISPPEDLYVIQEKMSDKLTCIEGLIAEVVSAAFSFSVDKAAEVNSVFSDLLKKIEHVMEDLKDVILKDVVSSKCNFPRTNGLGFIDSLLRYLKELLQDGKCDSVVKHHIEEAREELYLLRYFLKEVEKKKHEFEEVKKHDLWTEVISLAYQAECIIDCLVTGDYPVWYLHLLCKITTETKVVRDHLKEFHATITQEVEGPIEEQTPNPVRQVVETTQLDEVMVGFKDETDLLIEQLTIGPKNLDVVSIVGMPELLQDGKCDSVVKHHIEEAREELYLLRYFLKEVEKKKHEFEEVKKHDLWTEVISLAYQAECIIDCLVTGDYPVWYLHLLCKITTETKVVRDHLKEFHATITQEVEGPIEEQTPNPVRQVVETTQLDEVMVGFKDETDLLIEQLTIGPKNLDVVSIVGMPGLGKTTLAKKVFHDEKMQRHFDIQAMCCVSQTYDRRKLPLGILNQVKGSNQQNEKNPEDALRKFLLRKKYLLYIDDIWSVETWKYLRRCLPDDNNGSRILLTSRLSDVASKIKPDRAPLHLRFLDENESWELMRIKLFKEQTCPPDLSKVGANIASKCKGLPLLVILVAGVLSGISENEESWRRIAESIKLDTVTSAKECMEVIELSYKHMPDHLKPCFLYFASFQEDEEIPLSNLAWLWTIEGLVPNIGLDAKILLNDLIGRSLIMVSKRKSTGGVRTCRIHDMLHDFCVTKSKEEKFMQLTSTGKTDLSSSFYEHRRLCIHHSLYWAGKIGNMQVRSAFFRPPKSGCQEFLDLENFKLLRVLQMECTMSESSFQRSKELIHLKYLGIKGYMVSMPLWISNLSNLEVLLVITVGSGTILPMTIWNMPRLKHVHVEPVASFDGRIPQTSTNICCIETLATVSLTNELVDYMVKKV